MDNVFWVALIPFLISVVAGLVTPYIIDISRRKTVFYTIITKQPKTHKKEYTISTLFIWCDKYHVITEDDIDKAFPPCIEIDSDHEIYGVEIIREPNRPDFNRASIENNTKNCKLLFKQLDFNNVITLSIRHSYGEINDCLKFISNINAEKVKNVNIALKHKEWRLLAHIGAEIFVYFLTVFLLTNANDIYWMLAIICGFVFLVFVINLLAAVFNINQCLLPKLIHNHIDNIG